MAELKAQLQAQQTRQDKTTRQLEKARARVQGCENVCTNQQSLIELQAEQIGKLKHKLRKYKRRVVTRDAMIVELQGMMAELGHLNGYHLGGLYPVTQSYERQPLTQSMMHDENQDPQMARPHKSRTRYEEQSRKALI